MRKSLLCLLWLALVPASAEAHARLDHAVPAVGATVTAPPKELSITFSEGVEPAFSSIEVTDATGKRVDTGSLRTAPDNRQVLVVDLPPLPPGIYQVTWHAVSVDTHKTQGSYSFSVGVR